MHVWYRFVLFKWNNSTILYRLNGLDHVKPVCFDGQLSFNEHLPVIKNHWICLFGPHSIQWNGCKWSFEWHLPLLHALLNLVRYGHNAFFMKSTFSKSNGKQGSKNPSPLHKSSKSFSYISELPERKTHKYLRNSHVKTQCCKSHQSRLLLFALLYQSCVSNSCWVLFFPHCKFQSTPLSSNERKPMYFGNSYSIPSYVVLWGETRNVIYSLVHFIPPSTIPKQIAWIKSDTSLSWRFFSKPIQNNVQFVTSVSSKPIDV